jgi:hypothetical protein
VAFAVENVLAAYSGTTVALHEYFDQTGVSTRRYYTPDDYLVTHAPQNSFLSCVKTHSAVVDDVRLAVELEIGTRQPE